MMLTLILIYVRLFMELSEVSLICKALSDQNRLQIIYLLTYGEQCACELLEQMKITQPTLSHHMKVLENCSLVISRERKMEPLFPEQGPVGRFPWVCRINPGCR